MNKTYPPVFTEVMALDWFLMQLGQHKDSISLSFRDGRVIVSVVDGHLEHHFGLGTYTTSASRMQRLWNEFHTEWNFAEHRSRRDMFVIWKQSAVGRMDPGVVESLLAHGFTIRPGFMNDPRWSKTLVAQAA